LNLRIDIRSEENDKLDKNRDFVFLVKHVRSLEVATALTTCKKLN
jgi:hypothetical protein